MNKPFSGTATRSAATAVFALPILALAVSCGSVPNVAGRPTPPDFDKKNYPRAMVAVQNPNAQTPGSLQFLDVLHDTASNKENSVHNYSVSGYTGALPLTIQDYPGEGEAFVYGEGGSGSFAIVNTLTDSSPGGVPLIGPASSINASPDGHYVYTANPTYNGGLITVIRVADNYTTKIPLSNVNKLAMSPGGSAVLAFQSNTNNVYMIQGINNQNSIYDTVAQVPAPPGGYDRPINAVYSADGAFAYVMNCGPECGGTTASVTVLSTTPDTTGVFPVVASIPIPGGATYGLQNGTTLYIAGQHLQNGYFTGTLSTIDVAAGSATQYKVTSTVGIGDGFHFRMQLADDDTLWVGAKTCTGGLRAQQGTSTGCITMVSLSGNTALVEPPHGDAYGIAPIYQVGNLYTFGHKVYTTEGGAVYIYATSDGSAIDASLVQVVGFATDIAFVDGLYNQLP